LAKKMNRSIAKPNPGMLLRAEERHGLDLVRSIMIGDKGSDMHAATKAVVGVRCHYLAGAEEKASCPTSRRTRFIFCERGFCCWLNQCSRRPWNMIEQFFEYCVRKSANVSRI